MSIDISAKLMLVPDVDVYKHFESQLTELPFYEILEDLGLDYASPWFDADPSEWVVGIELKPASYSDLHEGLTCWWTDYHNAVQDLQDLFGFGCTLKAVQDVI